MSNVLKRIEHQFCDLYFLIYGRSKCNHLAKKHLFPKDAQCSETDFLIHEFFLCDFYFFRYGGFCIQQWLTVNWEQQKNSEFQYKIDHISKTKTWKIDFSFVSAYFASFM